MASSISNRDLATAFVSPEAGAIHSVVQTLKKENDAHAAADAPAANEADAKYALDIAKSNFEYVHFVNKQKYGTAPTSYALNQDFSIQIRADNEGGEGLVPLRGERHGFTNLETLPLFMLLPNQKSINGFWGSYLRFFAQSRKIDLGNHTFQKVETHFIGSLLPLDRANNDGRFCPLLQSNLPDGVVKVVYYLAVSSLGIRGIRIPIFKYKGQIQEINCGENKNEYELWRISAVSDKTFAKAQQQSKTAAAKLMGEHIFTVMMICDNPDITAKVQQAIQPSVPKPISHPKLFGCIPIPCCAPYLKKWFRLTCCGRTCCVAYRCFCPSNKQPKARSASQNGSKAAVQQMTASRESMTVAAITMSSVPVSAFSNASAPPLTTRDTAVPHTAVVASASVCSVTTSSFATKGGTVTTQLTPMQPHLVPQKKDNDLGAINVGIISKGGKSNTKLTMLTSNQNDRLEHIIAFFFKGFAAKQKAGPDDIEREDWAAKDFVKLAIEAGKLAVRDHSAE